AFSPIFFASSRLPVNTYPKKCGGYFGYVFTGNLELAKKIGLKASRKIEFYTSTIDCRLLEYELYEGSRRVV
ncbi:MAG TPA: hypothetical protein VK616_01000, partial [Flavitalea sp.]|nr:hypothetical protein [Flavitalea sp.]